MDAFALLLFAFGLLLVLAGVLIQPSTNSLIKATPASLKNLAHPPVAPVSIEPKPEPAPAPTPKPTISVNSEHKNISLFQKDGYLYHDHNRENLYQRDENGFKLNNVAGIKRFGRGTFSYDGFEFLFEHSAGNLHFPVETVEQISFYPNCTVILSKGDKPVSLIFTDETESIRKVLETFRVENGR